MKTWSKYICIFLVLLCIAGCKKENKNEPTISSATEFDKAYASFYGAHYAADGIENNVVAIDLYSPKLGLNEEGYIEGTGTNLYVSDIFLAPTDTLLPATTYKADTTAAPLTFLAGVEYEGNITGAYLLDIVDNEVSRITLLTEGQFSLQYKGDSVQMSFSMQTHDGRKYAATMRGVMPMYDMRPQPDTGSAE